MPTTDLASLLGPVGMGISAAGQIFGAIKSAKANKENQQLLNERNEANQADYDNAANKSFLDTNAAKDQVKAIDQQAEKARKDAAGRSVMTGASDEAIVAGNSNVQKNVNNATSRLAGQATQYQENQKRMYLRRNDSLDNMQMGMTKEKADNADNLSSNASDLFSTVTYGSGMKPEKTEKTQDYTDALGKTGD